MYPMGVLWARGKEICGTSGDSGTVGGPQIIIGNYNDYHSLNSMPLPFLSQLQRLHCWSNQRLIAPRLFLA